MTDLILHSGSCIGLCFILKYGSILSSIRDRLTTKNYFKELFSCSLCLGFWCGLLIGLVGNYNPLLFTTYGAAICWYADYILDIIISKGETTEHRTTLPSPSENSTLAKLEALQKNYL